MATHANSRQRGTSAAFGTKRPFVEGPQSGHYVRSDRGGLAPGAPTMMNAKPDGFAILILLPGIAASLANFSRTVSGFGSGGVAFLIRSAQPERARISAMSAS